MLNRLHIDRDIDNVLIIGHLKSPNSIGGQPSLFSQETMSVSELRLWK